MTADLTTRVRTDLPASKPPVEPVDAQSVADLVTLAADHAERVGSVVRLVHDFGQASLRCTIVDAVFRAADESGAAPGVRDDALRLAKKYLGVEDLIAWSKAPGRRLDEVVGALRGAGTEARPKAYVPSTAGRDPFEVMGVKPGAPDDIPF